MLLVLLPPLPAHVAARLCVVDDDCGPLGADVGAYFADVFDPWRLASALAVLAIAVVVRAHSGPGVTTASVVGLVAVVFVYATPAHLAALLGSGAGLAETAEYLAFLKTFDLLTLALPLALVLYALAVGVARPQRAAKGPEGRYP
ncbi:hypothetical protein BJH93_02305 [Kocuria polaris]|nr:hypothetical protein [Kocuria polaris]